MLLGYKSGRKDPKWGAGEVEANSSAQTLRREHMQNTCMMRAEDHGKGYRQPWETCGEQVTPDLDLLEGLVRVGYLGREGISGGGDHRPRGA